MYIKFSNRQDLIDFLLETYTPFEDIQFIQWNCNKFKLSNYNTEIEASTEYYDFNKKKFLVFGNKNELNKKQNFSEHGYLYLLETSISINKTKKHYLTQNDLNGAHDEKEKHYLKDIFKDFVNNNKNFTFDIKLTYPRDLKETFDKNDEYEDFCINFFSNGIEHGLIFSYKENIKDANVESPMSWITFCYNLYLNFLENKKQYNKGL